ncbi:hypothetical protein D9757_000241 [Collybiopsis confluens]|uniref:Uncharacterized protein n=1 Tax=Collybiopsis confluens TaxID=2823264 RepID=A0A8H5I248_9AGAR|nr:hypothetical protein D9757_000241 [Collybiopsis confluens]
MDACNSNPTLPLQDYAHHHGMARRQNYSPRVQRQRVPRARLTEAFRAPTPARSAIIESTLPSRPQASRSRQHATSASRPYPYYPPRRPIQRSLFADRQLPEVEPMPLELSDSQIPSPSSSYLHTARANPGISLRPDSFSSPSPVHQSPSPAARALFDHTLFNLYAGLARLQSAWSSALNREKKEKEVLRAYCLKLQRERDIVLEQTCEIEERQTPAVSYSVVTAGDEYSRTYSGENGSIQLPIPHARCSLALTNVDEASQCGSVRNGSLTLVYPSGSSVSPSPPPPPISGRQFLFSPSEENLSNSLPTPPPTSVFSTKNSNKRARSSSSCSSRSEQEESSAVAQASGDGGISPSPNSNGSDGECDMDISDNDSSDRKPTISLPTIYDQVKQGKNCFLMTIRTKSRRNIRTLAILLLRLVPQARRALLSSHIKSRL